MDPLRCIRNGFVNPAPAGFSFPCRMGLRGSIFIDFQSVENRHPAEENGPHTSPYLSFYGRLYGGNMCNVKT